MLVENYFKSFTMPPGYWVGTSRASVGANWVNVDGSPLPQNASYDPYAHFTWLQASYVGGCLPQAGWIIMLLSPGPSAQANFHRPVQGPFPATTK
jgi:hypothetical protein